MLSFYFENRETENISMSVVEISNTITTVQKDSLVVVKKKQMKETFQWEG